MEQVAENMSVEIPDAMIEEQARRMLEDYSQRVTSQGISFDQYLAMTGLSVDMLKEQAHEGAIRVVKRELAMDAIVAAEKLEATEEDLKAEYAKLGEQYQMPAEEIAKIVPAEDLKLDIVRRKAAEMVYTSGKAGKATAKKAAKTEEGPAPEEKPAKKTAKKKTEEKAEEKPEKKPAAKKTAKKAKSEE